MPLNQELPDYTFALRNADGRSARVNDQILTASFILAPDTLIEQWQPQPAAELAPADLEPLLALNPELVLLGTGQQQVFPPAATLAACLTRGVGLEVMANNAAARTYNVLAGEGRRVVAGFLLEG